MIHEIDLLNDEQLEYINLYFKHLTFRDGRISNPDSLKVCETVFDGPGHLDMNIYCRDIISHADLPVKISAISQIYFVKYDIGGMYEDHYDAVMCGGVKSDYSMTCFLSDDYEGGELVIDDAIPVKLNKGKAIIYPGDLIHRVNEVTLGRRDVFVCWLQK